MAKKYVDGIIYRLKKQYPWEWRRGQLGANQTGWLGCEMVNRLCPRDLCQLPPGHEGVRENVHWLGTSVDPMQLDRRAVRMAPDIGVPHTEESLVALGWALDYKLNPREFERVFGEQINIEEMIKWPE